MTVIKVDPASIKRYGTSALQEFADLNNQLKTLVSETASVHYHGTNAFEFKTKCSDMAIEYAQSAQKDMRSISDAVRTATSNIAKCSAARRSPSTRPMQRRSRSQRSPRVTARKKSARTPSSR